MIDNMDLVWEFYPEFMTPREVEIIRLVAKGKSNEEIASELFISKHTVLTHRKNINRKLNVSNPVLMIEKAREFGYLNPSRAE